MIKYFSLPVSVGCLVYRKANDEESLPLVSVSKGYAYLLSVQKNAHMNQKRRGELLSFSSSSWRSQPTRPGPLGRRMTSSSPAPACSRRGRQGTADRPHVFSCNFVKGASL